MQRVRWDRVRSTACAICCEPIASRVGHGGFSHPLAVAELIRVLKLDLAAEQRVVPQSGVR